jgi:hypothetical protein
MEAGANAEADPIRAAIIAVDFMFISGVMKLYKVG